MLTPTTLFRLSYYHSVHQSTGYCDCKIGYGGEDCSLRLCPKAFDPLTIDQYPNRRTIRLITGAESGYLSGVLKFQMGPEKVLMLTLTLTLTLSLSLTRILTLRC